MKDENKKLWAAKKKRTVCLGGRNGGRNADGS